MSAIECILLGLLVLLLTYCALLAVSALLVDPKKAYTEDSPFYRWLLDSSIWLAVHILRIHMDVRELDGIPKHRPVFFVGNHRSNFDPILTWYVLKDYKIGFLSKAGNFKIPLYGRIIRRCGCTAIDRENPRNAAATIRAAAARLQMGEGTVGAYPEGTRNKKSSGLLPFHNGLFKVAKWAQTPIVVLALDGTENIARNYPFHKTNVTFTVAGIISAEDAAAMNTVEIGTRVRGLLEDALSAHENHPERTEETL